MIPEVFVSQAIQENILSLLPPRKAANGSTSRTIRAKEQEVQCDESMDVSAIDSKNKSKSYFPAHAQTAQGHVPPIYLYVSRVKPN